MFRDRLGRAIRVLLVLQGVGQVWAAAMSPILISGIGPEDEPLTRAQQVQIDGAVQLCVFLVPLAAAASVAAGIGLLSGWRRHLLLVIAAAAHLFVAIALFAVGAAFMTAGVLLSVAPIAVAALVTTSQQLPRKSMRAAGQNASCRPQLPLGERRHRR